MLFAYLDEFGHIGGFVHRKDARYNSSPVFGMAGLILPEFSIRPFASAFLQLKSETFRADLAGSGKQGFNWEKKGQEIFRPKALERYPALREVGFRLLSLVKRFEGKVFYYGREKIMGVTDGNSTGLYTTVFSKTIRRLDSYAVEKASNFSMVVDEHSARKELLECAAKTMYGNQPARKLVSPPFEVESYINQNIQAADWVASIVGRIWAYRCLPDQFADHEVVDRYFGDRITSLAAYSTVEKRRSRRPIADQQTALAAALAAAKAMSIKPEHSVPVLGVTAEASVLASTTIRETIRYSVTDKR